MAIALPNEVWRGGMDGLLVGGTEFGFGLLTGRNGPGRLRVAGPDVNNLDCRPHRTITPGAVG
jgi:hypothetical protein